MECYTQHSHIFMRLSQKLDLQKREMNNNLSLHNKATQNLLATRHLLHASTCMLFIRMLADDNDGDNSLLFRECFNFISED